MKNINFKMFREITYLIKQALISPFYSVGLPKHFFTIRIEPTTQFRCIKCGSFLVIVRMNLPCQHHDCIWINQTYLELCFVDRADLHET